MNMRKTDKGFFYLGQNRMTHQGLKKRIAKFMTHKNSQFEYTIAFDPVTVEVVATVVA